MNRKLLVVAAVVVVAGGASTYAFFALARHDPPHPHPASSGESAHASGMDRAMGAVRAEFEAPEGATPCETAYNAFKASMDYSTQEHVQAIVLRLAPRDEFLQRCSAFPELTQKCLTPRYLARNRPECLKAKPPAGALTPLVEVKPPVETENPPEEEPPPPGAP